MASDRQVVLVTGCSSGLGRALCECLHKATHADSAQPIYRVFATARRPDTLAELADSGIDTLRLDVSSDESVAECVKSVIERAGRIDAVVNNAGILAVSPLVETPIEDISKVLDTNVVGVFRVIQAVAPGMMERKAGLIVNIGSVSAYLTTPFGGVYAGSKACLHNMTDSLRMELAPWNIKVITIEAGAFKSSIGDNGRQRLVTGRNTEYGKIAHRIEERLFISQAKDTGVVSADVAASEIVSAMRKEDPPFRVRVAGKAWYYKLLGFINQYVAPGYVLSRMCEKFGLTELKRLVAGQ